MELLLIRHAQSANNALPESRRVEDPGLTELGRAQAEQLAAACRGWGVERLVTSAFRRALMTATQLASQLSDALPNSPEIWPEIHEVGGCYAGHLEGQLVGRPGMNAAEISREFPQFRIAGEIPDEGWWGSRPYETDDQAVQRAQRQAARMCAAASAAARTAFVIHADFKAMCLEALLGDAWPRLADESLRNTGVTLLSCESDRVELVKFNDVSHLDAGLISD